MHVTKHLKITFYKSGRMMIVQTVNNGFFSVGSNVVLEAVEDFEGHKERDMCFNKRDLLMVDHKT